MRPYSGVGGDDVRGQEECKGEEEGAAVQAQREGGQHEEERGGEDKGVERADVGKRLCEEIPAGEGKNGGGRWEEEEWGEEGRREGQGRMEGEGR
ncbi:unnamed protein product [Closterium sp. NIES-54]